MAFKGFFTNRLRSRSGLNRSSRYGTSRTDQFFPTAIIESDAEIELVIVGSLRFRSSDKLINIWWQSFTRAENTDLYTLVGQPAQVTLHVGFEQSKQSIDLGDGSSPILGRERIDRERFQTDFLRRFNRSSKRLDTAFMPHSARHTSALRPPSIAIHDDRNVIGKRAGVGSTIPFSGG